MFRLGHRPRRLVLLYYFVYCKSFNVLSRFSAAPAFGAKSSAKLRRISELTKFFGKKISFFSPAFRLTPGLPRKASAKLLHFSPISKFFRDFFQKNFAPFSLQLDCQQFRETSFTSPKLHQLFLKPVSVAGSLVSHLCAVIINCR